MPLSLLMSAGSGNPARDRRTIDPPYCCCQGVKHRGRGRPHHPLGLAHHPSNPLHHPRPYSLSHLISRHMPLSPKTSRPATPSSSSTNTTSTKNRYGYGAAFYHHSPHFSRSRSSLPQPKVLPFPDLPVRPISHESSRVSSPFPSPAPTRRSSSQDVNGGIHRVIASTSSTSMLITGSSDSNDPSSSATHLISPISPHTSSPLSGTSTPIQPILEGVQVSKRMRSQTTPSSSGRPIPVPPILNLNNTPSRTQHGFIPVPVTPPSGPSSAPEASTAQPQAPRSSSLPTSTPAIPPILRDPPRPTAPVKKMSNPPIPPPQAMQIAPVLSHQVLSDHMYQSFLKGTCADIRLYVRKWGVGWLVHKVILVQAG